MAVVITAEGDGGEPEGLGLLQPGSGQANALGRQVHIDRPQVGQVHAVARLIGSTRNAGSGGGGASGAGGSPGWAASNGVGGGKLASCARQEERANQLARNKVAVRIVGFLFYRWPRCCPDCLLHAI